MIRYARPFALLLFLALSPCLSAAPFFRLRDSHLAYHGPAEEATNLTEIRLGWFGPHDNTNQPGAGMWWAASLAVREANEQGGCRGLPFTLVPCWATQPWGAGVSQLARMVYDAQPLALLGSVDSAATHLAEQVVAKANLPLVSPVATDKTATLAGVSWMFACAPSDDAIARLLVAGVVEALHGRSKKLVLLTGTDHESRMTAREVLREFSRRGRPPDFRFEVPPGAPTVQEQMAALAEARPEAVVVVAGADEAAQLVRRIRAQHPQALLFGSHMLGRARFLELAGPAAEGIRFPLLCPLNSADTHTGQFMTRFTAAHQRLPDYPAVLAYDATRLLLAAIRRAGPNRARIRQALGVLSPWSGIGGDIEFDGTGQNTRANVRMAAIRDGTVVLLPLIPKPNPPTNHTARL